MLRRWNRHLALLLAVVMVFTTFGTDFSSVKAADGEYVEAESDNQQGEESELWEKIPGEDSGEDASEPEDAGEDSSSEEEASDEASEGSTDTEDAATEDSATEESTEDAAAEATSDDAATESSSTEDAASDSSSDDAATESSSTEDAASDSSSDDAATESSSAVEEKLVTVKYKATLGGQVSKSKETIDINDKDAAFEGSTASARNKYYQFVAWKDEDGNTVSSESTFVPSDVEADTTFTAEFMKLSLMPAADFSGSVAGMNVSVHADEGIFPEGTTMSVSAITEKEAVDAAKDALGENVKEAKGVDITFRNADGEEIEPADAKYVHVTITLSDGLEGESFSVVHKDDEGNATKVAEATSEGADFETNSFSVYIVAGEGHEDDDEHNKAVCTYTFYYDGNVFNTQRVKKGDKLADPGVPNLEDNEEFFGWFIKDTDTKVQFGEIFGQFEPDSKVDVEARIQSTYYLTYIGVDDEVARVDKLTVEKEAPVVDLTTFHVTPKKDTQAFKGWALKKNGEVLKSIDLSTLTKENRVVYAVVVDAVWIYFDENDDTYKDGIKVESGGADYTGPVYVQLGEKPAKPDEYKDPTRPGYDFGGWYKEIDEDTREVKEDSKYDVWNTVITEDKDITLFAKWVPKKDTQYTVVIWQQKITDTKETTDNKAKTYDFKGSFVEYGETGTVVKAEDAVTKYAGKCDKHFHASWAKVVRYVNGVETPCDTIRAKGDTVINVYCDRDLMTVKFYKKKNKWSNTWVEDGLILQGLYGQTLAFNKVKWPETGNFILRNTVYLDEPLYLDFLDTFIFDAYTTGDVLEVCRQDETEKYEVVIHYYKEKLNGEWEESYKVTHYTDEDYEFYCDDYYTGFEPSFYTRGDSEEKIALKVGDLIKGTGPDDVKLYFKRKTYEVEFYDNFEGKITKYEGADKEFKTVPYEAPMNDGSVLKSGINYSTLAPKLADRPGYVFVGWYLDTLGTEATKYKWDDTMPAANKILYAHYEKIKCNVTLITNGGTYTGGANEIVANEQYHFRVDYGDTLDKTTLINSIKKDGEQFVGWFMSDDDNATPCSYSAVFNDIILYAKWRNPGIVKIVYDAGAHGSKPPVDGFNYSPSSTVVVAAPPAEVEKDYTFIGWQIIKDGQVADTIGTLYPNNSFSISKELITEAEDGTQQVILRALYEKVGGPGSSTAKTTITYHSNDGKDNTKLVSEKTDADGNKIDDLRVNMAVTALSLEGAFGEGYNRPGYKFLGWSKESDATSPWLQAGMEYRIAADNKDLDEKGNNHNDLYAVWQELPKVRVTIEGIDGIDDYDGTEHTTTGYNVISIEYYIGEAWVETTTEAPYTEADFGLAQGVKAEASRTNKGTTPMGLEVSTNSSSFANFSQVYANIEFNVVKDGSQTIRPIEFVFPVVGNTKTVQYNGKKQSVEGYTLTIPEKAKMFFEGEQPLDKVIFTGEAKAEGVEVDTYPMNLKADQFSNTNDNITVKFDVTDGWLKITPIEDEVVVTIVGHNSTDDYNGEEQSVDGYDVTISNPLYTENDFTFSGKAVAARTDKGTTPMGLAVEQFKNINTNFKKVTFKVTDGFQTINPIEFEVPVVGNTKTVAYDGKLHDVTGYELTLPKEAEKFYEGEKPVDKITFTGEAKAEGIEVNTYPMNLKAEQFSNNNENITVKFVITDGWLKITPADEVVVTIVGHKSRDDYNGKEQSVEGYDVTISNPLYTEDDFTFSGKAVAARTDKGTTPMGLTVDQFQNINKNFEKVTFEVTDGYQTVDPIEFVVPVVGNTKTVTYDGKLHDVTGYELTLPEEAKKFYEGNDPVDKITFTGEAKAEGIAINTYPMNLKASQFSNNNDNITVKFDITDGWLKIVGRTDGELFVIKAVTDSVTKYYTGETYSGFGYTLSASVKENKVLAFLSSIFSPAKEEPSAGDVVTIDGVNFTVKGIHVDTAERNVGEYPIAIEGYDSIEITDENGNVVTDQFTKLEKEEGTLTILPIDIVITSATDQKVYDGTPLVNHKITTSIEWCPGDEVSYNVTGSQTLVGSSSNTFDIIADELIYKNYRVTKVLGTLTVTQETTPPDDPTPDDPTPTPDDPTPTPPTPSLPPVIEEQAVLGARREPENGQAVLGARRAKTSDETNDLARLFAILAAAIVAVGLLLSFKKKEEQDNQ